MGLGRLGARLVIGGLFVGHGLQKANGSFGGPGLEGTEQMTKALGLHPARRNAVTVAATETAGGAAIALGAATPLAAASLIGVMITAIRKVHLPSGFWNSNGGYEFNLTLVAALLALVETGPGRLSFDGLLGRERKGTGWALAALATGAAAAAAVEIVAENHPAPPEVDLGSDVAQAAVDDDTAGDPTTVEP